MGARNGPGDGRDQLPDVDPSANRGRKGTRSNPPRKIQACSRPHEGGGRRIWPAGMAVAGVARHLLGDARVETREEGAADHAAPGDLPAVATGVSTRTIDR